MITGTENTGRSLTGMLKLRSVIPALLLSFAAAVSFAHENTVRAQQKAVEEYLQALASGSPQAVAYAIHPDELVRLRTDILQKLRAEAERGEGTLRTRLFGAALPLAEIERLTPISFYGTLARRLNMPGREYRDYRYLGAILEGDDMAQIIVRGETPRERGEPRGVQVVNVVTLKRYGKDWKAALPTEALAQIDDLMHGRKSMANARVLASGSSSAETPGGADPAGAPSGTASGSATPAAVRERLAAAEKSLGESKCEEYYREHMSPRFRRMIAKKALESLIASCQNNLGNREVLLGALRIVSGLEPRFEYNGQRAVYDVSGHGLPFDSFALELVDQRWYIAE